MSGRTETYGATTTIGMEEGLRDAFGPLSALTTYRVETVNPFDVEDGGRNQDCDNIRLRNLRHWSIIHDLHQAGRILLDVLLVGHDDR